ncbi:MAG: histidine phosphatase family protein, partial [Rhodocyclaceae bacterium]|nr:histidine phosphatase family protein [Rhodocyclaceae bacterium]
RWPDGRVLVVTPGGVLSALRNFITGAGLSAPRDFAIPNTGINRIRYRVGGPYEIELWGDERHLTSAARDEVVR